MAKSQIPEGKKRYYLTLSESNMDWLSYFITKVCNQPRNQIGVTIDEMLSSMKDAIQPILDRYEQTGRKPTSADLMIILGKQLQEIGSEEIRLPLK